MMLSSRHPTQHRQPVNFVVSRKNMSAQCRHNVRPSDGA